MEKPFKQLTSNKYSAYTPWLIGLFLITITAVVYSPVRHHEFINFDDGGYVYENKHVQEGLNADSIKWAFTLVKTDEISYWHPVTWLSHMLDCQLFGIDPGYHHLSNLFYHILNVLLLFLLFFLMTGAIWKSAAVAALFALHPVNVDSVAWISERKNLLSTTFWMLTMLTYIYYAARPALWRYLLMTIIFTLGLMAKPMLVTLPCALLLLDFWPLRRSEWFQKNWIDKQGLPSSKCPSFQTAPLSRLIIEKIPLLILSFGAIWMSFLSLQKNSQILNKIIAPYSLRMENAIVSYFHYLWHMIWPANLAVFYPFPKTIPIWQPIAAALALIFITLLVIGYSKKFPYLVTGWFWYVGTLMPVIGIIQGGLWPQIADRWAYVPYVGVFILLAWGIPDIFSRFQSKRLILKVLGFAIIVIFFVITSGQLEYWQNTNTLFQHTLNVTCDNYLAHMQVGHYFAQKNDHAKAMQHFQKAIDIFPNYADAHESMGDEYILLKDYNQALTHYQKALLFAPSSFKLFNIIGNVYALMGHYDKAVQYYRDAIAINPEDPTIYNSLGFAYYAAGQLDMARQNINKAIALKPDYAEAYYSMGLIEIKSGNLSMALKQLQKTIALNPDYAEAYYSMGLVEIKSENPSMALKQFQKAVALNPDYTEAHNSLGKLFFQAGNLPEAMNHFKQVLRLSPKDASANYNIGVILYMQQNLPDAARYFQQALQINPEYEKAKAALQLTKK